MISSTRPDRTISSFVTIIINKNDTVTASVCHENSAGISPGTMLVLPSVSLTAL